MRYYFDNGAMDETWQTINFLINLFFICIFFFLNNYIIKRRHTEYTSQDDGSNRTRVRFNLEGPHGSAFVFAEVSSDMPSGEFVYGMSQV